MQHARASPFVWQINGQADTTLSHRQLVAPFDLMNKTRCHTPICGATIVIRPKTHDDWSIHIA